MKIKFKDKNISAGRLEIIAQANIIIEEYLAAGYKLTLRQLFYQFVARGWLENKQKNYKRLGDILGDARLAGLVDWDALSDNLRELDELPTWDSPEEILHAISRQFRFDIWESQEYRPEVWVEKDALSEVVVKAAHRLRVPVMVCRGYMSISTMFDSGYNRFQDYVDDGQTPVVIHLGDHDPSGMDMTRDLKKRLSMFAGHRVKVDRIALNMDQIEEYDPPPNPAKTTDSRSTGYIERFGRSSWELDALEPRVLDGLITKTIERYMDQDEFDSRLEEEDEEKKTLRKIARNYDDVKDFLSE